MAVIIPVVSKFDDKGLKQAKSAFAGIGSSMKGILGAAGIAVGFSAIASGLKDATAAAIEDGKSQALLANQLRNTIGASNEQIASVEKSIRSMQAQSAVADDVLRPAFASLVRSTGDVTQATALTSLALDVAAGTGKNLSVVSLALGKAVNGSTTSLLKLVPSIKGASDPMAELAKQFKGASSEAANNDPIQRLNIIFGEMQETIGTALIPTLQDMATYFASDEGQKDINDTATAIKNLTTGFVNFGKAVAQVVDASGIGYLFAILTGDFSKADELLANIGIGTKADKNSIANSLQEAQGRFQVLGKSGSTISSGVLSGITGSASKAGTKKAVTDYVKEFGDNLADEMRKNMAKIRLQNKGLSEGLIESIIGSGQGWYTVYQSIVKQSDTALGRLQQNFNKTAAGLSEIAAAAEAAAEATKAANEELIATLTASLEIAQGKLDAINAELNPVAKSALEVYQEAKQAYDQLTAASAAFAKTIPDVVDGIRTMTQLAEPIGQFEQQVVSSFANVEASLKSALDSKLITDKSYTDLSAWAKREMSLMTEIAKQRDALAKKISLAEQVYNDSKNAILAYGNINGLLKTTSQTITETQTKIVDGISLTLTKSVEQVSQNNLVEQYKTILAKTKEFAANLNALKKMGLNKDLFKQIVDAGVETGGATAAAIIAGGQQSVTELNTVFTDLQAVGDQVGETTAVVMFNNGVDVMGGFINGMKAQADALATAAKTLADTFATAFGDALKTALQIAIDAAKAQMKAAMAALLAEKAALEGEIAALKTQIGAVGAPAPVVIDNAGDYVPVNGRGAGAIGFRGGTSLVDGGTNIFNVTVTNNDPNAVVDALRTYSKRNGTVVFA